MKNLFNFIIFLYKRINLKKEIKKLYNEFLVEKFSKENNFDKLLNKSKNIDVTNKISVLKETDNLVRDKEIEYLLYGKKYKISNIVLEKIKTYDILNPSKEEIRKLLNPDA